MARIEKLILNLRASATPPGVLSPTQRLYLERLRQGATIAQVVQEFLAQGHLVGFNEMFDLVRRLHEARLIQQPDVGRFFQTLTSVQREPEPGPQLGAIFKKEDPKRHLERHAFFRSMNPVITALFCQHAEIVEYPAGMVLCRQGAFERDLYFLIDGEVAIHRQLEGGGRRLIGLFGRNAVLGEVGFFMGEVRTADVVCARPCKVVRVRYQEAAFGRLINKEAASRLQTRFRVVHALAKSPFLQSLPDEAIDPLIFAGRLRQVKEYEAICREGESGDACFIVISGSFAISQGPRPIGVRGPGEAFGEVALFFTQGRRTATAMAQRESTVLEIPARDFYRLLGENLLLACEFEKMALERYQQVNRTRQQAA